MRCRSINLSGGFEQDYYFNLRSARERRAFCLELRAPEKEKVNKIAHAALTSGEDKGAPASRRLCRCN